MRRLILTALLVSSTLASAQAPRERKEAREEALKKKETAITPDKSLAGDISRKKETKTVAPTLTYDNVRIGLELSAASKRRELIEDLKKIIEFSQDKKEKPTLFFRLGELYWEESKYFFFEANRKDDEKLQAMNRDDKAGMERAEAEKQEILLKSKEFGAMAMEQYSTIVQQYKDYERTDEVLYFLGLNLMEMGDEKKGVAAYKRLVEKYKKSKYQADAWLALGEYYFNNAKGKREYLDKALDAYKAAAGFTDSAVYGYAMYKQGWCYFNLSDFDRSMDQFKAVILYADFAGASEVEGNDKKGKGSRAGLVKEARADFVRAFARGTGTPTEAKDKFAKLTKTPDELRLMMRQLANLMYEDGKDKEAAQTFDMLIKERPTSPEAPGFQSKIIDCVMRSGNKRVTVQQVRRLVKIQDDVLSKNAKLEDKDKKALDEARELAERTISNLAVNWHNEAKKTRDDETFGLANEVYADYLTLFPDNPKSYELRFFWSTLLFDNLNKYEKAAEEYTKVFLIDVAKIEKGGNGPDGKPLKPGKFMNDAAYNSIFSWDEVVKAAVSSGEIKPEPITDPTKKGTIPAKKKALLDACERYLKYVDKGDKKVEITYKVAKIYYDYNWLDEAVQRFADIAMNHPEHKFADGDKAGEIAANLILDSYNLQGDWVKVNEWARKFYGNEKLAQGKFREDLAKLIEQSSFKLVNQLEARKDYAKAAEAYMTFVGEFPKSELADKALFNASIDFFNAKMLDKAIEVRKQIIQRYPKSPHVPAVMFALAEGYEAITSFTEAAEFYETYAANYEKNRGPTGRRGSRPAPRAVATGARAAPEQVWEEQKAQDAIFNAGIFRDGLGQYKQALRLREKYLELWPDSKEAEAVTKSITDLYEKMGAWSKVNASLEDYEKKFIRDPNKVLTAEGRIANVFEEKLKNPSGAKRIYLRITDYYEKLPRKQREALEITALDAVARADFLANEKDWAYYSGLKLKWSTMQNVGELKASIKNKAAALEEIQKKYTKTVTYKSADPAICALHKIGLAYDQFANQLENPPVPKGIPEELLMEVKAQFSDQAKPVKDKAAEAFAAAVQKSQELDVFNPCTTQALEQLRTKYRPEQYPRMREDVPEVKLEAGRELVIGQDILGTIQSVTVLSPEKAAELKSKAREAGRDTADMKPANNPEIDLTGPAPTPAPTPRKGSATPAPAPTPTKSPSTPGKQPKNADAEPEEPL